MDNVTKIQIAGVGGQGVVFLTNLIVEAALLSDMHVYTSEIHGLSQRGGSVTAGITIGEKSNGFIEKGGADFLIGLEILEAQRCTDYLHNKSIAVIDDFKITPYSVNAGEKKYPDHRKYFKWLQQNIQQVIFVDSTDGIKDILRNVFLLGLVSSLPSFPLKNNEIISAMKQNVSARNLEETLLAYEKGKKFVTHNVV